MDGCTICQSAVEWRLLPKCTWTYKCCICGVVYMCKETEIWLDRSGCAAWRLSKPRGIGSPDDRLKCMACRATTKLCMVDGQDALPWVWQTFGVAWLSPFKTEPALCKWCLKAWEQTKQPPFLVPESLTGPEALAPFLRPESLGVVPKARAKAKAQSLRPKASAVSSGALQGDPRTSRTSRTSSERGRAQPKAKETPWQ
jgi:hypothetical protein